MDPIGVQHCEIEDPTLHEFQKKSQHRSTSAGWHDENMCQKETGSIKNPKG